MIRHTVAFTLRHSAGSEAELAFMKKALVLAEIPGVKKFEQLRQVSPKCSFAFGFSMEFDDQSAYDAYNRHPTHTEFVKEFWQSEVTAFQEIDYVSLS
ncbi:Dabb family protein [Roseinatronobacter sp. S2]|uniref:Dabb family protein n=1 Tax=Roseinatronobacter sp. S2 TaxID=3035471 RepID=UPI0024102B59|nr:Dabb family protein [Roseinatronobacter sp. S2]WFE73356.1 Dabb family protein [Roseinatronobacter sp. S2]